MLMQELKSKVLSLKDVNVWFSLRLSVIRNYMPMVTLALQIARRLVFIIKVK